VELEGTVQLTTSGRETEVITARAKAVKLSPNGASISIDNLPPTYIPILLKRFQRCSAVVQLPGAAGPVHISGEIVWVEIRGDGPRPRTLFGMQLTETDPAERNRLATFLTTISARESG
jgi:hypothetical protein